MISKIKDSPIVESYKLEEIEKFLQEKKLMDFIPAVKLKVDIKILFLWREYFKDLKVPYAITKGTEGFTLWKEEVANEKVY